MKMSILREMWRDLPSGESRDMASWKLAPPMSLGAPQWLWGLLAIPLLVALFLIAEKRGEKRLREFVSARLLPQLAGTVNRFRHALRFALQLLGLAFALIALAQPRWGYTFQDVKRKGLDLLIAVDTSRSMLSNDVQPNRLERVKLAAQDLISELQGDRVGLIAFAGRAFLQAPLTIDYGAVVESINDLDTKTVPEGGTNISEAIALASRTFGKSAMGNRALILFTDGEELSGDAVKAAKAAADAGVRIFTVGVGTPQGSLIPISGEDGETAFVKDSAGQVVKSKLDENRLREVAQVSGGIYLHLENGPSTMQQIYSEGLAKMQAAEFDVRLSRRPIERYEWPLGAALIALALSILIGERKRARGGRAFTCATEARANSCGPAPVVFSKCCRFRAGTPTLSRWQLRRCLPQFSGRLAESSRFIGERQNAVRCWNCRLQNARLRQGGASFQRRTSLNRQGSPRKQSFQHGADIGRARRHGQERRGRADRFEERTNSL